MLKSKKIFPLLFSLFVVTTSLSLAFSPMSVMKLTGATSFPKILFYLFDFVTILFIVVTFLNFWQKPELFRNFLDFFRRSRSLSISLILFSGLAAASFFWSGSPVISLIAGARLFLVATSVFMAVFFVSYSKKLKIIFFLSLVFASLTQSMVAVGQFVAKHSLGLKLLGESYLDREVLGLAKINLSQETFLRAYGTLPHPNILGGFQLFAIFITLSFYLENCSIFSKKTYRIILLGQGVGLLLSFSRTAALGALILALVVLTFKKITRHSITKTVAIILLAVMAIFFLRGVANQSFWKSEPVFLRIKMAEANFERFLSSPLLGRGWGTGPEELTAFSDFPFYFFEKQPVHNIFVLALADLGLAGLAMLIFALYSSVRLSLVREKFFALGLIAFLPIGMLDHYLLTLPIGNFIFFWLLFGSLAKKEPGRKKIAK